MLKFPTRIKNCQNHYTAQTTVPVDRGDNSCVWRDNSVLHKSGIYLSYGWHVLVKYKVGSY